MMDTQTDGGEQVLKVSKVCSRTEDTKCNCQIYPLGVSIVFSPS